MAHKGLMQKDSDRALLPMIIFLGTKPGTFCSAVSFHLNESKMSEIHSQSTPSKWKMKMRAKMELRLCDHRMSPLGHPYSLSIIQMYIKLTM